jgi:molecular chaperone DnaJ
MSSDRDAAGDSLYDTLGVSDDATEAEITKAFRRLARERHPDINPSGAAEAFAELTDAYDVLRDATRRRDYDDTRRSRGRATAVIGVRIPVHHGTAAAERPRPEGSATAEVELHLTFAQAALGTTATMPIEVDDPCDTCAGTGVAGAGPACADCNGAGATIRTSGGISIRTECPHCGGRGRTEPQMCRACRGSCRRHRTRVVPIPVPAGVRDGTRLRVPFPGGDVNAIVRVDRHPYFTRIGNDVAIRIPVTIAEASLGAVLTVPTLDGDIDIRLPAGTPSRRTMRVKGKGIPAPDRTGDLLVTIDIAIPSELNDTQRSALETFAAATESPRRHLHSAHSTKEEP